MGILRTLIQLEVPINDLNCDEYSTDLVVTSEELRQSAIDDIKELKEDIELSTTTPKIGDYGEETSNEQDLMDKGAIEYIKQKFNITEDDLNE